MESGRAETQGSIGLHRKGLKAGQGRAGASRGLGTRSPGAEQQVEQQPGSRLLLEVNFWGKPLCCKDPGLAMEVGYRGRLGREQSISALSDFIPPPGSVGD